MESWDSLTLEEKVEFVKKRQDEDLKELEEENQDLWEQVQNLQTQAEVNARLNSQILDLKQQIQDLNEENEQLNQENERWAALSKNWQLTDLVSLKVWTSLRDGLKSLKEKELNGLDGYSKRLVDLKKKDPNLYKEIMKEYRQLEMEAQKQNQN